MRAHWNLAAILLGAAVLAPDIVQADGTNQRPPDPYAYVPEVLVREYSWTGFYIGGHAGGGTAGWGWTFTAPNEAIDQRVTNFLGGAHAGFQKQWSWLVLGAEVGYSWADLGDTSASTAAVGTTRTSELKNMLTVAGRVGYAQEHMLAYFKGGAASADITFQSGIPGSGVATSSSGREWGWLAGAGLEYGLTQNLTIGLEYEYINFSTDRRVQVPTGLGVAGSTAGGSVDIQTLTARLNFKFP